MSPGEKPRHGGLSAQLRLPGEQALIAIVAMLFLILHIFASSIMQRAAAGGPAPVRDEARISLYD